MASVQSAVGPLDSMAYNYRYSRQESGQQNPLHKTE
jgi:hypothetical protein